MSTRIAGSVTRWSSRSSDHIAGSAPAGARPCGATGVATSARASAVSEALVTDDLSELVLESRDHKRGPSSDERAGRWFREGRTRKRSFTLRQQQATSRIGVVRRLQGMSASRLDQPRADALDRFHATIVQVVGALAWAWRGGVYVQERLLEVQRP